MNNSSSFEIMQYIQHNICEQIKNNTVDTLNVNFNETLYDSEKKTLKEFINFSTHILNPQTPEEHDMYNILKEQKIVTHNYSNEYFQALYLELCYQ